MQNGLTLEGGKATNYNVIQLLILGLIFHLIYIGTVFDCYFTSPVVNGMQRHSVGQREAKRLVLIVADGLRADLLFNLNPFPFIPNSPKVSAPHLRSIVETRGAFGVSHTRVPTESRPGHVAIIGGMYEDVSAVTKGWKTNPVDFDSVFNQSSHTFSFGSPDILPMFSRGATPGKVRTWCYDEGEEDFTKDATALDVWVLDQFRSLLQNATVDVALNTQLHSDRLVFFFHLLGLDTTGHSYRPHSPEYQRNIRVVDDIVGQIETSMHDFYGDNDTSYIFTADHGMSVIGNHGDGDPDNTRTPLIAWGCGIRGPLPDSSPSSHDSYSRPWGLSHLYRRDIEQADVATLMTALLGINFPINSVGVLPDIDHSRPGYLSPREGEKVIAQAALANAKVIIEHYTIKHNLKKSRTLFYKPFEPLEMTSDSNSRRPYRLEALETIESAIENGDWHNARKTSAALITTGLNGLHYLQTYERFLIRGVVTVAYVGWAAYASLFIFRPFDQAQRLVMSRRESFAINFLALVTLAGFWTLFLVQQSPWSFYVYIAFPCYFWRRVLLELVPFFSNIARYETGSSGKALVIASASIAVLQGMVIAYTHRIMWSLGFVLMGTLWPLSWSKEHRSQYPFVAKVWVLLCFVSAIFPVLSVEKKESLTSIISGGSIILLCGWAAASYDLVDLDKTIQLRRKSVNKIFILQGLLILMAMIVTISSVKSLQTKQGLPFLNQVLGWITLVTASLIPFICGKTCQTSSSKLLLYFFGFGPCFVILSISVEGMFYVSYVATLTAWVMTESIVRNGSLHHILKKEKEYKFQLDDLRIALFFLFFVQVGFFGIGNVASISSFYLEPVYRLIPIFNPFFMATLLMFKIIAPYIILSIVTALLNHFLHLPPFSLLLLALTLTDGMTITFFFTVKDTGSWLEIGQSITFFCITSLLLLWSTGICVAGEYLLSDIITTYDGIKKE